MKLKTIALIGGASLLIASVAAAQMLRSGYDEPAFELVSKDGEFEVREYEPRIVALTSLRTSDWRAGTSSGFGRLAEYIFAKKRGGQDKIAMTTPVETVADDADEVVVMFTMPPEYEVEDLPTPEDGRVQLRTLPAETVAVLRFSGTARSKSLDPLEVKLRSSLQKAGWTAVGAVRIAQYDPPWIPGPLRRNELMVRVERAE